MLVRQHLALRPTMAAAPFFMRGGATDVIRHMTWHKQRYFKALRYTMDKIFDRGIGVCIEALKSCPTFVGRISPAGISRRLPGAHQFPLDFRPRSIRARAPPSRRPFPAPAQKTTAATLSRRSSMEAQGIEPWSESASRTASTCVGGISCRHSGPVTSRPSRSLSPRFSPRAPEPRAGPARIFDSGPTPQAGFGTEGA